MKWLEYIFTLFLFAPLAPAQNANSEGTLLYDTSRGKDYLEAGGKISLKSPLHFYDEKFSTVYAHTNGYVTFADEKVWLPAYFRDSKLMAPCMVEIRDNNNLGLIRYLSTTEEHQLGRAAADVNAHFASETNFRAQQVVVIEWSGLLSREILIQNVIIIGKKKTFALFLFKNRNGNSLGSAIEGLDAQSGLSSGDKVRYTELLNYRQNRGIEHLFTSSNTMVPGKWIFFIGSTNKDFFQVKMPDTYSVYDASLGKIIKKDIDECKQGISTCHRFADCSNIIPGYKCICSRPYFGNGKTCLREFANVNIEGTMTGIVNDMNIGSTELTAFTSNFRGQLFVTVAPVSPALGNSLQIIPPISGLLGWLFGKRVSGKLGFEVVGDRFKSTSIIIFKTGEILYIKQEMKGYNAFNNLIFNTEFRGNMPIPLTNASSVQRIKPYSEKYTYGEQKNIYGQGSATYIVDGNSIQYTVNRLVHYETLNTVLEYQVLVSVRDTVTSYYQNSNLLQFRQKYFIEQDSSAKPTESRPIASETSRPHGRTTTIDEERAATTTATRGPRDATTESKVATTTAPEITSNGPVTIKATDDPPTVAPKKLFTNTEISENFEETRAPTTGLLTAPTKTKKITKQSLETKAQTFPVPTTLTPCENRCSENANCVALKDQRKCVCKEGFIGNGTSCVVDKRINCGSYKCDEDSLCIKEQSQYFCKCKKGYIGDGVKCFVDTPCRCHINAECYGSDEGKKICVCKLGFVGDGKRCKDIDECRDMKIVCQSNSKCSNTMGSYNCLCDKGFRKNGTNCEDIPECTEQKDACGERAICTEKSGSYQCRCPQGYHFGNRKRDCFPDCQRCLNGGTCVGKFACKCAPGYSGEICQWVGDEFLLYAQGGNVKRFSYPYGPMSYGYVHRSASNLFVGVDYDCQDKKIYWTDVTSGSIQRSNYDGSAMEVVISGLVDPQGITIDWLGRNVFWTDSGLDNIQVSTLDGSHRRILFADGISRPRPIVCDPYTGQLFWADWERANPRIEVSSMDGTDRKILVSQAVGLPNGLTIDYKAGDLCWTDAALQALSCVGMDGRNPRQLTKVDGYPFGITIHESLIYWTNWATDDIGKFDKRSNEEMLAVRSGFSVDGRLFDIKSVSACPSRRNVCSYNKGGCSDLCLARNDGGKTCV